MVGVRSNQTLMRPELDEIYQARRRLSGRVYRTPLMHSLWLSSLAGTEVYLKLECWQRTRSFKVRGAFNAVALLTPEERERGLVAASAGNHGQGVALAGREFGVKTTVFVPESAPVMKREGIEAHGATLEEVPGIYEDAEEAAIAWAKEEGATFIHPFGDPGVIAGQGTIGLEIAEDLPEVTGVIVPVGGGGLITGVGRVMQALGRGAVRIVGAQGEEARAMHASFEVGGAVEVPQGPTLADGLAGGRVDLESHRRTRGVTEEIVLVSEAAIGEAIRDLFRYDGIVAEGAGAVPVAAILSGMVQLRGPSVLVISGGNIDGARLAQILRGD